MNPNKGLSRSELELNTPPPAGLAQGVHKLMPKIAAAWTKKYWPPIMNAPVGPPKEREVGELTALPTPIQLEDSSSQPIAKLSAERKPSPSSGPKKSGWPPLAPELIKAVEEAEPAKTIACRVQLRLALCEDGKGPPAFGHFDRSDTFCRLLIVTLNIENPATRAGLEKHNSSAIGFFVAVALAKCLQRSPRSVLTETLLREIETRADIAPNGRLSTTAFARRLAQSPLLAGLAFLPIFGRAFGNAVGRSFALAEIDLAIPVAELGAPWDR